MFINSSYFTLGSSSIDWCEYNYVVVDHVAEFYNTISNLPFMILPPILINLHHNYVNIMGNGIHLMWYMLIIVGVASAFFHATLSQFGQLLDEISILWCVLSGYALWFPKQHLPHCLKDEDGRKTFYCFVSIQYYNEY